MGWKKVECTKTKEKWELADYWTLQYQPNKYSALKESSKG